MKFAPVAALAIATLVTITHAAQNDTRIQAGVEEKVGQKRYVASLRETRGGQTECGGALIHPKFVVTAAHCAEDNIKFVSVGTHYRSGTQDGFQTKVIKEFIHPQYNEESHDLMILELEDPVPDDIATPVAIARRDGSDNPPGTKATIFGWGRTYFMGPHTNELHRVDLTIESNEICSARLNSNLRMDDSMLCAASKGWGRASLGDSGGPLIVEKRGGDVLVGLMSWGPMLAAPGDPAAYASISNGMKFIKKHVPDARFLA
jgi:secreted trypsin-like serine protease